MADKGVSIKSTAEKGPYKVDKSTMNLGKTHTKDTLEYNLRHAEDHLQAAREACEKLDKLDPSHKVPVTKSLLDLMDYFEKEVGHDQAEHRLKDHISKNY